VSGTVAGGDLAFTKTDGTAIDVVVVNGTGGGGFAGTDFATGTNNVDNGSAADTSANVTITVAGGGNITLTGADRDANITQLQSALNTQAAGTYTVAASGASAISITTTATGAGATAPAIAGTDAATFGTVSTVNGAAGQSVTVNNDFSIQLGSASAVAVANGSYSSPQAIVDAVNTALGGNAIASLNSSNQLVISAGQDDIAITGTVGTTTLGLAASTTASGSLSTANVLDVSAANDAIYRIDSALTSVSDLRSTFGAIQNRFESTIANLSSTTENLSASRSRIQDADFAAETANLTRAQILQQAGVSILAQANALPQNVLALLQ
jgi:flagellin